MLRHFNIKTFIKAQASAIIATALDFSILILLTDFFHFWYILSNVIAASIGALVNFLLGRYWAFNAKDKKITSQAIKYVFVSVGSLLLNTTGLYLLTDISHFHYVTSKVIVAAIIAVFYNYILQKIYVFK